MHYIIFTDTGLEAHVVAFLHVGFLSQQLATTASRHDHHLCADPDAGEGLLNVCRMFF